MCEFDCVLCILVFLFNFCLFVGVSSLGVLGVLRFEVCLVVGFGFDPVVWGLCCCKMLWFEIWCLEVVLLGRLCFLVFH